MTLWKTLFCAIVTILLASGFFSVATAQTLSRVSQYTATPFQATWTDISATGDTFHYNKVDQGWGTIAMPFDFPYDGSIVPSGTKINIGASGAISLSGDTTTNGPMLDSADHPGMVCVFSGTVVAGTGHASPADTDFFEVDGIAPNRVLTVEYHFMHIPGTGSGNGGKGAGGNAALIQVKFHETTGVIEFIYQAHNSAFEMDTPGIDSILYGCVGLNGFSKPSFVDNTYKTNLIATPDSDIRWTPGTPLQDSIVIARPFESFTCKPDVDTATITVTNTGNTSTSYSASIAAPNQSDFIILPPDTSAVEPAGGVATFQVVFDPSSDAEETADFIVTGDVGGSVILTGTGGAATISGSGTAPMTFPGQTSAPFDVTINNTGTCPWTPGMGQTVDDPAFTYVSGGTTPIPAGGNTTETFTYSPTKNAPDTATVSFPDATGTASSVMVTITAVTDGVQPGASNDGYSLEQNYPNPFNGASTCEITLPVGCIVHLSIVDIQGKIVQNVLNQHFDAGSFAVTLHANDLESGTYNYQMTAGDVTLTRQMVVIK